MVYVALLRAVNVGGTGALSMKELVRLCEDLGFGGVRTYIQSGNVVLHANGDEAAVKQAMQQALQAHTGKPVDVMVRTAAELRAILAANPFAGREPNKVAVHFLHEAPPAVTEAMAGTAGEQVSNGTREIYVWYPEGMGRSKLRLPLGKTPVTARNVNTVTRLSTMAEASE